MRDLRARLTELVAIDSTSSKSNLPIIDYLDDALRALGFVSQRQRWQDALGVEKANLIAIYRPPGCSEAEPIELALVGHTDTVPFSASWPQALALCEGHSEEGDEGTLLIGRGACDTKGFIACALEASALALRASLRRPLALIFTAEEELGCLGAKRLLEAALARPRRAIVGEPTGLTPVRAHKGYGLAHIEVQGAEGHSARPDSGRSAILGAAELISRIEVLTRTIRQESHADFEPPYSTLNIGTLSGGTAENVIPGNCGFTLEWRPVPGQPLERVLGVVEAAARDVAESRSLTIKIEAPRRDPPFESAVDSELVRFMVERSGRPAAAVSYFTEAPCLAALGAEVVVFGPGDIAVAHRTGEYVPEAQLLACRDTLAAAIERFC